MIAYVYLCLFCGLAFVFGYRKLEQTIATANTFWVCVEVILGQLLCFILAWIGYLVLSLPFIITIHVAVSIIGGMVILEQIARYTGVWKL